MTDDAPTKQHPDWLEEAGPPLPRMRYTGLADEPYPLSGVTDRLTLTYGSDLPLENFVRSGPGAIGTKP